MFQLPRNEKIKGEKNNAKGFSSVQHRDKFSARLIPFLHKKKHEREKTTKESETEGRIVPYLSEM
jgi:hypothetical protein